MTEIETFKATVEAFIKEKDLTPTSFGMKFAGDPGFVFQLRDGREPRTKTRLRVLEKLSKAEAAQ